MSDELDIVTISHHVSMLEYEHGGIVHAMTGMQSVGVETVDASGVRQTWAIGGEPMAKAMLELRKLPNLKASDVLPLLHAHAILMCTSYGSEISGP